MTEIKITKDMYDLDPDAKDYDKYIVTVDGKRYRVEFENDQDSTPFDADCYDTADIQAWRNDQWYYVGVIVTPLDVPESVQFRLSDDLWGLEYDFPLDPPQEHNGVTYRYTDADYQIMHYPVPNMIYEVIFKVKAYDLDNAWHNYCFS